MIHNKQIVISRANSRKAVIWPAQTLLWSEFVKLLETPVKSTETLEQFLKMPKTEQDELKDVGSFVAGELKDQRRKAANVINRHLITLDLDHIPPGGTDAVLTRVRSLDCAYVTYSTRKHAPWQPRLRVIFPLVTPVEADQYEPIARQLAASIGLEFADPTTFQANRLMHFPSCSSNSVYVYRFIDRPFLDGAALLDRYQDWRNMSEWPRLPGEDKAVMRLKTKQQNPLEKKGIVGAFCRQYSVMAAVEKFLPGIYTVGDIANRLTFIEGSTVGGAVIYDDVYLYSHHATDPCSMKLVNAFDLVRLHKFEQLDDGAKTNTPPNRMPSYLAMSELAKADSGVVALLQAEATESAKADFAQKLQNQNTETAVELKDDLSWFSAIELHEKTGKPLPNPQNVITLLEHSQAVKGRIKFDVFNHRLIGVAPLPWSPRNEEKGEFAWGEDDHAGLRNYVSSMLGFRNREIVKDGFTEIYNRHRFHPAKTYIEDLVWDGTPRVETLFIDWLCAEDIPGYTRLATKQFMKAMMKRVYEPGCDYQEVIILVGEQGNFKSKLLNELANGWYTSALDTLDTKVVGERTAGAWLVCLEELTLFAKQSEEAKKEFISRRVEKYRPAYGTQAEEFPRAFVLTGTTNRTEFLGDYTGDRRYLPILCGKTEAIMAKDPDNNFKLVVDQLLAEAYALYQQDDFIGIPKENWDLFAKAREYFRYENDYLEDVLTVLEKENYPKRISVEWLAGQIPYIGTKPNRKTKLELADAVQRTKRYERIMKPATAFGKTTRNAFDKIYRP